MPAITYAEGFRQFHQRRVPKVFNDYSESESYTILMFHGNETIFE